MSDLISRSELLEEIKSLSIVLNGKQIFSDDAKDTILRIINEQPTAYSVDKVVEELEALRNGLNIKCDNLNDALEKGKKIGYNKAIDDCLKIVEWDGYTLDIKHRIEQLKAGVLND